MVLFDYVNVLTLMS